MNLSKRAKLGLAGGLLSAGIGWAGASCAVEAIAEPMRPLPARITAHKDQLQKVERMRWALGKSVGEACVNSIWDRLQFGLPPQEVYDQYVTNASLNCPGDADTVRAIINGVERVRVVHTRVNSAISQGEQAVSYLDYNDSPRNMLRIITATAAGVLGVAVAVGQAQSKQ